MRKPILCVDFDGVVHSYVSGWVAAHFIPDPPVPGAFLWLAEAIKHFEVRIYSTRSSEDGGIPAMATWMEYWAKKELPKAEADAVINAICNNEDAFPVQKPAAFLTIDDRAICFAGDWSALHPESLLQFKPWNKRFAPRHR